MITKEMSESIDMLLHQTAIVPEENRAEIVLYISTYLMNHAAMLLSFEAKSDIAKEYLALSQQMEALSLVARARKPRAAKPSLRIVSGSRGEEKW